ncbi:delta-endotoxin CytB [Marasmius fiardii PR-910]|nr:delta-endotoxin CytB [Marasmius fiardii PR-910]
MIKSTDKQYFDRFSKVPDDLDSTSRQVPQFAADFVDLKEPNSFKWPKFMDNLSAYEGDDLVLSKYQNNTIGQGESTLQTIIAQIVAILQSASSVPFTPEDTASISKLVEGAFTDLKAAKDKGIADFKSPSFGNTSCWAYRVEFSFDNADLEEYFYTVLATIKLEADIREESEWLKLSGSVKKKFVVEVDAMELLVRSGFKNPRR